MLESNRALEVDNEMWGEIWSYETPAPDVFFLYGKRDEGYALPVDYNGTIFSAKALAYGKEHKGVIYFSWGPYSKPMEFELFTWKINHPMPGECISEMAKRLTDIQQYGYIDVPDYFGHYPPPIRTPEGKVEDFLEISNGIYWVKTKKKCALAICEPIWKAELSYMAHRYGRIANDFMFFDDPMYAIPFSELLEYGQYPELRKSIKTEHLLEQEIENQFPDYILQNHSFQLSQLDDRTYIGDKLPRRLEGERVEFLSSLPFQK